MLELTWVLYLGQLLPVEVIRMEHLHNNETCLRHASKTVYPCHSCQPQCISTYAVEKVRRLMQSRMYVSLESLQLKSRRCSDNFEVPSTCVLESSHWSEQRNRLVSFRTS